MTYAAQADPSRAPLSSAEKIALTFCSTSILYMMVFGVSRYFAIQSMAAFSVLTCIGLLFAKKVYFGQKIAWFFLLSISYLFLSFEDALPRAWTIYWNAEAAIRQWIWVILIPLFTAGAAYVFVVAKDHIIRNALKYVIATYLLTRLSLITAPYEKDLPIFNLVTIYTFVSENLIVTFFLALYMIYRVKVTILNVFLFLAILPSFSSAQSLVGYFIIYFIWLTGMGRWSIVALSAALALFLAIAPYCVGILYQIDGNTGFRALLWRDAIHALTQSHGLGVGYGTEYITNDFSEYRDRGWVITGESSGDRLLIGTHSTFYDILMRTGIAGVITFGFWFADMIKRSLSGVGPNAKMNACVGSLLIIVNAVNMGVTAVSFMLSTCLCCGWLLANTEPAKRVLKGRAARAGRVLHA